MSEGGPRSQVRTGAEEQRLGTFIEDQRPDTVSPPCQGDGRGHQGEDGKGRKGRADVDSKGADSCQIT